MATDIMDESLYFDPLVPPEDGKLAERAEANTLHALSRALVTEISIQLVEGGPEVERVAELAVIIDTVGIKAQVPALWAELGRVLTLAAAPAISDDEHLAALRPRDGANPTSSNFVAHGLLSLRPTVRLGQAAVSQAGVLQQLWIECKILGIDFGRYASAIARFWTKVIDDVPFRFSSPREVAQQITYALKLPPLERAKAVLRAVLFGLSATVTPDIRSWLAAAKAV